MPKLLSLYENYICGNWLESVFKELDNELTELTAKLASSGLPILSYEDATLEDHLRKDDANH